MTAYVKRFYSLKRQGFHNLDGSIGSSLQRSPKAIMVGLLVLALSQTALAQKFTWSEPVAFNGLTADEILGGFPGTKIAGGLSGHQGAPVTVTPGTGSPIVFAAPGTFGTLSGGYGYASGAFTNQTGNSEFNNVLSSFYYDGGAHTITLSGLVIGQVYSVQLFALDQRFVSDRSTNWQDPNDEANISATYMMTNAMYVVGTFTASSSTESIKQNLPLEGNGNFNCLILRAVGFDPPPYFVAQPTNVVGLDGGSAVMTCTVAGDTTISNPTITYQWQAGPSGGPYTNLVEGTKYVGVNTASLTINELGTADAALVYLLVASNGGGSTTGSAISLLIESAVEPEVIGRWLDGATDYADKSGYTTPAGTHDGAIVGTETGFYFTNDVPGQATGSSLYLANSNCLVIGNTKSSDSGYVDTFDDKISNRFSVSFWAKGFPLTAADWVPALVAKRGEDNTGWQVRRRWDMNPIFTIRGTAGDDDPGGSISVTATNWHHYAATWDGISGIRRLYIDGKLSTEVLGDTGPLALAKNSPLRIGARDRGAAPEAFVEGVSFYDVRMYNAALSISQVDQIIQEVDPKVPTLSIAVVNNQVVVTWDVGTLLENTSLQFGGWTTNSAAESPYPVDPATPTQFFKVQNP